MKYDICARRSGREVTRDLDSICPSLSGYNCIDRHHWCSFGNLGYCSISRCLFHFFWQHFVAFCIQVLPTPCQMSFCGCLLLEDRIPPISILYPETLRTFQISVISSRNHLLQEWKVTDFQRCMNSVCVCACVFTRL